MSNQPSTELEFFPYLNQSQLTDLKKFWEVLDQTLLTPNNNQHDGKTTKSKAESIVPERIKNLVGESENERLSNELWTWIMMDDPDKMLLKYIRAKKFKSTIDSLELLINSLKFRLDRKLSTIYYEDPSILKQLQTSKAFVFGFDKSGSPIFRINAAKHKISDQSPRELEDFILYSMEVTRLFVVPPAETASMLIDLSGFGMSNMDWKCASFMISTLESYYPETLNHQIIHNAPWIFQGFWKVISTMIDPVVRSKVLFTSKNEDLAKLVDKRNLFKAEGGESPFEWTIPANYPVDISAPASKSDPAEAEKDEQAKRRLHLDLTPEQESTKINQLNTRATVVSRFTCLTQLWLTASDGQSSAPEKLVKILALRELLKLILRAQYLRMMPLIIPKTIYHYRGILNTAEPGTIDFEAEGGTGKTNGSQEMQTAETAKPAMIGQEYARPSLLKTIEREISRFRSTYLPSSSSSTDALPDSSFHNKSPEQLDPIDRIFTEITQLEF